MPHAVEIEHVTKSFGSFVAVNDLSLQIPENTVYGFIGPNGSGKTTLFKAAIGLDYKAFERKLLEAIHRRFGLPPSLPERITMAIKMADRVAAYYEATQLAGFTETEANVPERLRQRLEALDAVPTAEAQAEFLARFEALSRNLSQE